MALGVAVVALVVAVVELLVDTEVVGTVITAKKNFFKCHFQVTKIITVLIDSENVMQWVATAT